MQHHQVTVKEYFPEKQRSEKNVLLKLALG